MFPYLPIDRTAGRVGLPVRCVARFNAHPRIIVRHRLSSLDRLFAEQGIEGLIRLPGIGRGIGAAIVGSIHTRQ